MHRTFEKGNRFEKGNWQFLSLLLPTERTTRQEEEKEVTHVQKDPASLFS